MKSIIVFFTSFLFEFIGILYIALMIMKYFNLRQLDSLDFSIKPIFYLLIGLSLDKLNKSEEEK